MKYTFKSGKVVETIDDYVLTVDSAVPEAAAAPDDIKSFAKAVKPSHRLVMAKDVGATGHDDDSEMIQHRDGRRSVWTRYFSLKIDKTAMGGKTLNQVLADNHFELVRELNFARNPDNEYLVIAKLVKGAIGTQATALEEKPPFLYADPLDDTSSNHSRWTPADPRFAMQWQWPAVKASNAWDITKGAGVKIAVIDRGFDLAGGFWDEIGFNAIETKSGRVDESSMLFKPGIRRAGATILPAFGHGTFVAAQAAARGGNQFGCGMAPDASLMLICAGSPARVTQAHLAIAIAEAVDLGADVIVCAEGPAESVAWTRDPIIYDAFDYARSHGRDGKGTAIVWAVANAAGNLAEDEVIDHPDVIRVGRTNRNGRPVKASATGQKLDFLAPGSLVWNIGNNHDFFFATGNSFAAPAVAGIAALALSANPALTRDQLYEALRVSCDPITVENDVKAADGRSHITGHGLLNAKKAVEEARRRIPNA